jgi:glycerol uptake facilitator-like aquaporin
MKRAIAAEAEAVGSFLLIATVVGSGIMAESLAGGNVAIALVGNTAATGAMLYVLITMLGPISGAHFNPAVTLVFRLLRVLDTRQSLGHVAAQLAGGVLGVWAAHLMFGLDLIQISTKVRTGMGQWTGELVATFGLVLTILGTLRHRPPGGARVGRTLHNRGLLVHFIDELRQPRDNARPGVDRYLCRDRPFGHTCFHRLPAGRRARRARRGPPAFPRSRSA